jgi:hypothetical protein
MQAGAHGEIDWTWRAERDEGEEGGQEEGREGGAADGGGRPRTSTTAAGANSPPPLASLALKSPLPSSHATHALAGGLDRGILSPYRALEAAKAPMFGR